MTKSPFKAEPDALTTRQALLHDYPNDFAFSQGFNHFKKGIFTPPADATEDYAREWHRGNNAAYLRAYKKARGIEKSLARR
jgi:hypothetical protein